MAAEYFIYPDWGVFVTRYTGLASDTDMLNTYRDVYADADFRPGFNELCDLRNAMTMDTSIGALQKVSEMTEAAHGPDSATTRTAYLVNSNMNELICKLYGVVAESGNTETTGRFFRTSEALEWLGIEGFPHDTI